jgi:glycosyltransferase involved in cell wall biosynthesis
MSKVRVLMLIPNLSGGGAERVFLTICRQLDRSRFDLTIGVLSREPNEYSNDIPTDVPIIELGCWRARHSFFRLLGLVRRVKPDLVFTNSSELNLVVGLLATVRRAAEVYVAREPNVAKVHNQNLPNSGLRGVLTRILYRSFDAIVCQSNAMRADLLSSYRLAAARLLVIHNPVDIDRVRAQAAEAFEAQAHDGANLPSNAISLVAAGRIDFQKDFALLIEALALCPDQRLHLSILGIGALRGEVQARAQVLGIADRVHWAGHVANPYPYFRQARCLIISSRYEGMPNVGLEALACGTPVISFALVNGLDDLAECCTGLTLLTERSAQALANELLCLASERVKRAVDVSVLNSPKIVADYAALFERLVSQARSKLRNHREK